MDFGFPSDLSKVRMHKREMHALYNRACVAPIEATGERPATDSYTPGREDRSPLSRWNIPLVSDSHGNVRHKGSCVTLYLCSEGRIGVDGYA